MKQSLTAALFLSCALFWTGCQQATLETAAAVLRQYVFVTNGKNDTVTVIDLGTFRVRGTIPVGRGPTGVTASPVRNEVYVVNTGSGTLEFLNAENLETGEAISLGRSPFGLELSPDGKTGTLPMRGPGTVSVVDLFGRKVSNTIPTGRIPRTGQSHAGRKTFGCIEPR